MVKRALITGGSSGIGYALSKKFAAAGYALFWVSENELQLKNAQARFIKLFPNTVLEVLSVDLSTHKGCLEVYNWTNQKGGIDVLVNSAGFGTFGPLHKMDESVELQMIGLNVTATYLLTRMFSKDMIARGHGKIGNVASNTALQPVPRMATYAATKSFIKQFSQSLHEEFRGTGVTVTTIIPAATSGTGFQERSGMSGVKTFKGWLTSEVDQVAAYAFDAIIKGDQVVFTSRILRLTRPLAILLPSKVIQWLISKELHKG